MDKHTPTPKSHLFVLIGLLLLIASFAGWYVFFYQVPEAISTQAVPKKAPLVIEQIIAPPVELPVKIIIPSLEIATTIEHVGIKKDGSMGVPSDVMNTGWYQFGPRPGAIGSAVIDGHVDWINNQTAVFANLKQLKPGDRVFVEDTSRQTHTFIVRELKLLDASADATLIFSSTDGKAHLNLITCDGTWNKAKRQYTKRLVVFTDKEEK